MRGNALYLKYDGLLSQSFNIYQVNFESGMMLTESLIPSRKINSVARQNSSITDFYSITESPLEFTINLYINSDFSLEDKERVIRWLKKDTYKELVFETMPDYIYYAVATKIDATHNTMSKGYITVDFICNAPWAFTNVQMSNEYIISNNADINIQSNSVFDTQIVKVMIETTSSGNLLIKNNTNQSELRFEELDNGLKITVDCLNHILEAYNTSNINVLINDNKTSHSWLELMAENNDISITGNCKIKIFWQGIKI